MSDLLDAATADLVTNIWGFDRVPDLPLTPAQVLGDYKRMGIFGPMGAVRINIISLPPETAGQPLKLQEMAAKLDLGTGASITPGKEGGWMHRTDSIDLTVVLKGETDVAYLGEDGQLREITIREGDFIVQKGAFHDWRNRSKEHCVILVVILAAERKPSR
ncbi:MAG TPA: cupin domain-containing protein [Stellaceae bacterium]|nr:cupin domain-containing protein [Stellaceae bacterium]